MSLKPDDALWIRRLCEQCPVGALGTLHQGRPFVSMVPFVLLADTATWPGQPVFIVHVSRLAAHTQDMLRHPAVSLMLMSDPGDVEGGAQATPRITVQAQAVALLPSGDGREHADQPAARQAYLQRFPAAEPMFGFGDFLLVAIVPEWLRVVIGFGRATTVMAREFAQAVARSTT